MCQTLLGTGTENENDVAKPYKKLTFYPEKAMVSTNCR